MTTILAQGSEHQLNQRWQQQLLPFWHQMNHGTIESHDGRLLHYSYHLANDRRRAVVISAGRIEMAIKYTELLYDLSSAGYSVFILDHRGQGASARLLPNPHKGYVSTFDDYSSDLQQFMQQVVIPQQHQQHLAVCHSMGSAIVCHYQHQQPAYPFDAVILSSPMLGIYTGAIPQVLAEKLVFMLQGLNHLYDKSDSWYFPGQHNYQPKEFAKNNLTGSEARFNWLQALYQQYPELCLGGVTVGWLNAAIAAMRQLQQQAGQWQTPVLLLQAADDTVVSNKQQNNWWQRLPASLYKKRVTLAHARHELFMETDSIRNQVLQHISQFLEQLPA
ncbi:alpha/beta fold hydrolase [Chromatiaceae bacterium AAb-1]|nr:alpha/beta fold hydrolase [Chromatiaceae bacterium AAb-1]